MLEDLGNCVKIHDTIIPAVNIQVEGFPKFVGDDWFGVYFEIMVEDGGLYILSQYHQDGFIVCDHYPLWADGDHSFFIPIELPNWKQFLAFWSVRQEVNDEYRRIVSQYLVFDVSYAGF